MKMEQITSKCLLMKLSILQAAPWLAATAGRSRGKKSIRGSRQDAVWIEKREVEDKMKYPIEENLPYAWLAIIVIAVFYAIYFAKMISQNCHR